MRPYLVRPPKFYRWLFTDAIFRMDENERSVYLTFDDGPHPEATPFVLDVLADHEVKATFFVLGKNALEHPHLLEEIRGNGHTVGNHGMNHLDGWRTPLAAYSKDVMFGKEATASSLFRPAYGRLSPMQFKQLKKDNTLVFWDVIAGDFDQQLAPKNVVDNVLQNVRNGSIIVFHDSQKALKLLKATLSEIIQQLAEKGYTFKAFEAG